MNPQPDETLGVLRQVWEGQGQSREDLDEVCVPQKICKKMVTVGFEGMAEDGDVRSAWKATLRREGKLRSEAPTIRDLVLGSGEAR
ncbi:MAG: hypothetical protein ABSH30_06885 [Acidimicrobiales bacterium]|jgi:hypothetical protein